MLVLHSLVCPSQAPPFQMKSFYYAFGSFFHSIKLHPGHLTEKSSETSLSSGGTAWVIENCLDEDVTNLGARLHTNTGQYVLSPNCFPTCCVLKQPSKHFFRLSIYKQFLPLHPYQEHSS